ncbi:MAG: hypothetical protein JRE12_15340 [Deltaproteobacteria bacterium]|nr:hypothetical protein [Deltaproteobacteria bacterium]
MKGNYYKSKYGYQVRFGRDICLHAANIQQAERILTGLRFKEDEGTFDSRDYKRGNPLGFEQLAKKWLKFKERTDIKPTSLAPLTNYMTQAIDYWGPTNIKAISDGDIEDFLWMRDDISSKIRANMRSGIHQFWKWVVRREKIPMPDIPTIPFELGWRNIIDIDTQQKIIEKVWEISHHINPKIWLGIRFLATYISIRPGELIGITEQEVNLKIGAIIIPHPKEKKPKITYLMDDDIEIIKSMPTGMPHMYFFRHPKGIPGVKPGTKFGVHYLWKWWKKACAELGIENVDLYGGTRHSTATALGNVCTPEEVKDATGHSSKAFERYFQGKASRAKMVTVKIKKLSGAYQHLINISEDTNIDKRLIFK